MAATELFKSVLKDNAGLKGYWRLESNFTDSSPSAYNLTANGTPGDITGTFGNGKSFVATTSWASITNALGPNLGVTGTAFSIGGWIKPTNTGGGWGAGYITSKRSASNGYYLAFAGGINPIVFIGDGAATASIQGGTTVVNDTWYHIFATYNGSKLRIYVNGKTDGEVAATLSMSSATTVPFYLGVNSNNTAEGFTGQLDDIAVLNVALSADQIKELYEGRSLGELWPQSGLVGSYHLSSTTDSSGNSNTLTNNNTVGFVAGKFSNCADFGTANTNKYLSRTDGLGVNLGSGAYSLSLWVKVRTAPSGTYQLIDWKSTTTTPSYFQLFYQFSVSLRIYTQFGDTGKVQNTDLGTTLWHHITCTCSAAGACAIYLNGSLLFTDTRTNSNAGNTLGIGASSVGGSPSSVYLDEVNFFNKELTANEIRRYYGWAVGKYQ